MWREAARKRSSLLCLRLPSYCLNQTVTLGTAVPVVPVAIRGTRQILPGESLFPRRGAIEVTIGAPLRAPAGAGDAFAAAVSLRDAARAQILRGCGEPDARLA
jgi:1-acyl-sn-glycerol-3-phosphate acyltransferase